MSTIAIDARLRGGVSGGIESVIIGLAGGLAKLTDGAERYLFLAHANSCDWLEPHIAGNCRIIHTRARNAVSGPRPALRQSDGVIEEAGANLIHFTHQAAFVTDVPFIYHPHDLQHLHLPENFTPEERQRRETVYRHYCEQAVMVAAASKWTRADFIRQYGLSADKVHVVTLAPLLGLLPIPTPQDLAAARQKFSLPEAFAFFPAQTWPHKNHLGLLDAIALLRDRGLIIPLICSGRTNEFFPTIEARIRERNLQDQVRFLGFVNGLDLQSLYRLCRCVVIPTLFEAASFPLCEANRAGAATACSNVTSLPDQAGDAAVLFDPRRPDSIAAALRRVWEDADLRLRLVELGRRRVAQTSWDLSARLFRAHYRRLCRAGLTDADRALLAAPSLF